jgi:hypothetical protein
MRRGRKPDGTAADHRDGKSVQVVIRQHFFLRSIIPELSNDHTKKRA